MPATVVSSSGRIADWIAVDWGTSNLRVWHMRDAQPLAEASSDKGMGGLSPEQFEPALLDLIDAWLPDGERTLVLACGMVGARQGWAETAYAEVPAPPVSAANCTRVPAIDPRLDMRIIPGLCQMDPPDVMRGEETQISGFLAGRPSHEGTLCLPGTHTKWVRVADGHVQSFRTMMTGELFGLLSTHSVLRHSVAEGVDNEAFAGAARRAQADPSALAGALFGIRAASLLSDLDGAQGGSRLSGLLIGAEIAAARPSGPITIIGTGTLAGLYHDALALAGHEVEIADARGVTLAGLCAAYREIHP